MDISDRKIKDEVLRKFRELYHNSLVVHTGTSWMGRKAQKCPADTWIYQDLLWKIKPDFVIETGTAWGGGTLFLANMLDIIGKGTVITVENDPDRPPEPLNHPRIIQLRGSSLDEKIITEIRQLVSCKTVFIILDSDHLYGHIVNELELYAPLVTLDSYIIVEDTHMQATRNATNEFISKHPEFIVDETCEKFILTFNPGGYLKRVK